MAAVEAISAVLMVALAVVFNASIINYQENEDLFESLRELRKQLAAEQGVPPYVIFHDTSLRDMARLRPSTREGLLEVFGVGEKKAAEGKCGGEKKATEGKCGEGKCGGEKKATEGKCGEGKCGGKN